MQTDWNTPSWPAKKKENRKFQSSNTMNMFEKQVLKQQIAFEAPAMKWPLTSS